MKTCRGELSKHVALADYTSWRIGGLAERLYKPHDLADLQVFLGSLAVSEPLLWLGLGSNTLIRDQGINGTVLITQGRLKQMEFLKDGVVRAEAGVACAQLARFVARSGLTGSEFLAGIPGTVGGALAMNAGCHGSETWQAVIAVETIDRAGNIRLRTPADFSVGYRQVVIPLGESFVAGHFFWQQRVPPEQALANIRSLLARRAATQPTGNYNCGSVFRNPPGDFAARLIEACGLKGFRIGDAYVSPKHANFIINAGHATAHDIETLIAHCADTVLAKHHVNLHTEVCIYGEK